VQRYDNFWGIAKEKYYLFLLQVHATQTVFNRESKTKKAVQLTMITTYGLAQGGYSYDIPNQVTMEESFENVNFSMELII